MASVGAHELLPANTKQVVFAHDTADPLGIHMPTLPSQLGGDPQAPVGGTIRGMASRKSMSN